MNYHSISLGIGFFTLPYQTNSCQMSMPPLHFLLIFALTKHTQFYYRLFTYFKINQHSLAPFNYRAKRATRRSRAFCPNTQHKPQVEEGHTLVPQGLSGSKFIYMVPFLLQRNMLGFTRQYFLARAFIFIYLLCDFHIL